MDELDENIGIVSTSYEIERERLNERPETISPATGASSKIGCLWLIAFVWLTAGLIWAITELISLFL